MYVNLGLIGFPLGHTLSPALHTHFLDISRVNGGYTCFEAGSASDLQPLMDIFRRYSFTGVNVTVPYKLEIMKYCDVIDKTAENAGAVNTLHFSGGKVYGHNTDVYGFGKLMESAGLSADGKDVLLIGAGGAARSVTSYFKNFRPSRLTVMNRTEEKALSLASSCGFETAVTGFSPSMRHKYDIIINSASLGLRGEEFPLIDASVSEAVVDLQYKPAVTPFLSNYEGEPVKKVNGFAMLVWQACRSFTIWTGKEPEPDMKKLAAAAYGL